MLLHRSVRALAALLSVTVNARTPQTPFVLREPSSHSIGSVLQVQGKGLLNDRLDMNKDKDPSHHRHTHWGASNFFFGSTAQDQLNSKCTDLLAPGDFTVYWVPTLFVILEDGSLEPVELFYPAVYYHFDETDDQIVNFALGTQIISGKPHQMEPPSASEIKYYRSHEDEEITNVGFTCPQRDENKSAWPENSDGSQAGIKVSNTVGMGFPSAPCDSENAPLRYDIYFESCFDPEKGVDKPGENMLFPIKAANGKLNCPKGTWHVPRIHMEAYWDVAKYAHLYRNGSHPFVLSTGDHAGFGLHGDVKIAWENEAMKKVATCDKLNDPSGNRMHECLGSETKKPECKYEHPDKMTDDQKDGPMSELPGGNPIYGWSYGKGTPPKKDGKDKDKDKDKEPKKPDVEDILDPTGGLPDQPQPTNVVENAAKNPEPTSAPPPAPPAPEPTSSSCAKKTKTVWETVTMTEQVEGTRPTEAPETPPEAPEAPKEPEAPEDPEIKKVRRHLHSHQKHGHGHF